MCCQKYKFTYFSFLIILFFFNIFIASRAIAAVNVATPSTKEAFRVLIDPGHGGEDPGATISKNGKKIFSEANLALSVALSLKEKLARNKKFNADITRANNQNLTLKQRVAIAEKYNADLLLSIHANSSPDKRARGVQFYFQNQLPPDEETLFLAEQENQNESQIEDSGPQQLSESAEISTIVDDLKRQVRIQNSLEFSKKLADQWAKSQKISATTVRQAPFYVISKTKVPSVLIELGFLTNTHDAQELMQKSNIDRMAERIYQALVEYRDGHKLKFPLN